MCKKQQKKKHIGQEHSDKSYNNFFQSVDQTRVVFFPKTLSKFVPFLGFFRLTRCSHSNTMMYNFQHCFEVVLFVAFFCKRKMCINIIVVDKGTTQNLNYLTLTNHKVQFFCLDSCQCAYLHRNAIRWEQFTLFLVDVFVDTC